jgi:hypothetical protein
MESKKWYQSKTIWGILIAFVGFLATLLNVPEVNVPADASFEVLKSQVADVIAAKSSIALLVSKLTTLFGTVLAIYGRVKADMKIEA